MNLVDEEHVPLSQVGEQGGQVPRLLNGRAGGDLQGGLHLVGDDLGQGGLAQAGRAVEQHMVQCFPPAPGGFYINGKVFLGLLLADIFL